MGEFDAKAGSWDEEPRRHARAHAVGDEIVRVLGSSTLVDMRGLEYGCGTGLLSFRLQPYLREMVLADNSSGMLAVVADKIRQSGIANMSCIEMDLTIEQPIRGEYGLICTLMVLHHIVRVDAVLAKFAEALAPTGYLCIADLDAEDGSFHGPGFDGHNGFRRDELVERLSRFGLSTVSDRICFEVDRLCSDGIERRYPVFCIIAQKGTKA